jgi:hypothetical protein
MHGKTLVLSLVFAVLAACDFESSNGNKPGYVGVTSENQAEMEELASFIQGQDLDAYSYTQDGQIWIGYRKSDEDFINRLLAELTHPGGRPLNHEGYCAGEEKSARELLKTLEEHSINAVLMEDERLDCDHCYCVYWPIEHNTEVEALDPVYRQMRSIEEGMER